MNDRDRIEMIDQIDQELDYYLLDFQNFFLKLDSSLEHQSVDVVSFVLKLTSYLAQACSATYGTER
jgi:hypothetical protein